MTTDPSRGRDFRWRLLFLAAACWTASGAIPGFVDPAWTFELFHGRSADSEHLLAIYRGAWGQSLLFGIGYLVASFDPRRHALVIGLGAVGKAVYAAGLLKMLHTGSGAPMAAVAAAGDLAFAAGFAVFFMRRPEASDI